MSRKKAKTGNGQVAHDLVELQDTKRELTQKLRRQKRSREKELEPLQRQVARLQRQIEQIGLRRDAPIEATALALAQIEAKIAVLSSTPPIVPQKESVFIKKTPAPRTAPDPFSTAMQL